MSKFYYTKKDTGIIRDLEFAIADFNALFQLSKASQSPSDRLQRIYFEVTAPDHNFERWIYHQHEVEENLDLFENYNPVFGTKTEADFMSIIGIIEHASRSLMYPDMRLDVPFSDSLPLIRPQVYLCAQSNASNSGLHFYVRAPEEIARMQDSKYALTKDYGYQ
jgi:hypothetical protein